MTPTMPKKPAHPDIPAGRAPAQAVDEARRLVIGQGIHLQGNVSSCAHLVVEGRIDATRVTAQRMDVLLGGHFTGVAEVQEAVISGHVEGRLSVRGRLVLRPGARVFGEVRYGSLQIEVGAQLNGSLAPIDAERPAVQEEASSNIEVLFAAQDIAPKQTLRDTSSTFRRYRG